jgi:hypothetical protein
MRLWPLVTRTFSIKPAHAPESPPPPTAVMVGTPAPPPSPATGPRQPPPPMQLHAGAEAAVAAASVNAAVAFQETRKRCLSVGEDVDQEGGAVAVAAAVRDGGGAEGEAGQEEDGDLGSLGSLPPKKRHAAEHRRRAHSQDSHGGTSCCSHSHSHSHSSPGGAVVVSAYDASLPPSPSLSLSSFPPSPCLSDALTDPPVASSAVGNVGGPLPPPTWPMGRGGGNGHPSSTLRPPRSGLGGGLRPGAFFAGLQQAPLPALSSSTTTHSGPRPNPAAVASARRLAALHVEVGKGSSSSSGGGGSGSSGGKGGGGGWGKAVAEGEEVEEGETTTTTTTTTTAVIGQPPPPPPPPAPAGAEIFQARVGSEFLRRILETAASRGTKAAIDLGAGGGVGGVPGNLAVAARLPEVSHSPASSSRDRAWEEAETARAPVGVGNEGDAQREAAELLATLRVRREEGGGARE